MKKMVNFFYKKTRCKEFKNLSSQVIYLNNQEELKKVFDWKLDPILADPMIFQYETVEDVNERRIRDAESIGTVICNTNPSTLLEIGTAEGHGTALIADNAPKSTIFTINISPEEIVLGNGGVFTTIVLEKEKIGSYYRNKNYNNIHQIFANTATWEPHIGNIDVAFIDGCHDADFVYNDTKKLLKSMNKGSFILWHDFNLKLADKYAWIHSVCEGVERLIQDNLIKNRIFQIEDSWVGITQI